MNRNEMAIIDTFKEESAEVLTKTLLLNDEVDFTEFSYDIKLFKISRIHAFGAQTDAGIDILAYHIEIFNLNEPELVYRYRLPVSGVQPCDPLTFVVDVFNLINHNQVKVTGSQAESSIDGIPRINLTRYRQLLNRYIDNNIVLIVQENKFPAQLNLALIEVSSGLHWNTTFDSVAEVNFPGNFCLLDLSAQ